MSFFLPVLVFSTDNKCFDLLWVCYLRNWATLLLLHLKYLSIMLLLSALFEMFWDLSIRPGND